MMQVVPLGVGRHDERAELIDQMAADQSEQNCGCRYHE